MLNLVFILLIVIDIILNPFLLKLSFSISFIDILLIEILLIGNLASLYF